MEGNYIFIAYNNMEQIEVFKETQTFKNVFIDPNESIDFIEIENANQSMEELKGAIAEYVEENGLAENQYKCFLQF